MATTKVSLYKERFVFAGLLHKTLECVFVLRTRFYHSIKTFVIESVDSIY